MTAGAEVAPAKLGHLISRSVRSFMRSVASEMIAVGDGELRRRARLVLAVFPDPERGGREGGEQAGEIVQEAPELARVVGERRQRLEAVDRDDPRPVAP